MNFPSHSGAPSVPGLFLAFWALATAAWGQAGDRPGETQNPVPDHIQIPPAPVLSPEEALRSFTLAEGFEIDLVASEPLVEDPIAMAWDARGRLWVVEMRGFMPNVDGEGEREPEGNIVILSDQNRDGTMDHRQVFMDELVLPRGVLPFGKGALVLAPPDLLYVIDEDGDDEADQWEVVDTGFQAGLHNPEHAINGLMVGLDNWIECANHHLRYRYRQDVWERQYTGGGGQWGLTMDDLGRLFFNTNSDPLRADFISSRYVVRNPNFGRGPGGNEGVGAKRRLWSGRVNAGVNRGYRQGTLLEDGRLAQFTAACGPLIYRGGVFPEAYHGAAFVPEPSGNLVKCYTLQQDDGGRLHASEMFEGTEFLTSTDERFRPVNAYNGPDGGLYLVDLYRGILQHRVFMTTFLRRQVLERGLDRPTGLGRIYRILPTGAKPEAATKLEEADWSELLPALSHPQSWYRDQAQQQWIARGRRSQTAHDLVRRHALQAAEPLGRIHALWALEGMGGLDLSLVQAALKDPDERVVYEAVRLAESLLAAPSAAPLADQLRQLFDQGSGRLRWQILLSLGEAANEAGDAHLADLLAESAGKAPARAAVLSGLHQREFSFLKRLAIHPGWQAGDKGQATTFRLLARSVVREGRSSRVQDLLDFVAGLTSDWQQQAVLQGILDGRPKGPDGKPTYIPLAEAPATKEDWAASLVESARSLGEKLYGQLAWPGREDIEWVSVPPLSPEDKLRFEQGRDLFSRDCASCHQSSGLGEPGKAPPLRYQPWVLGSKRRLIRIVAGGLTGPIKINNREWNLEMPAYAASDEEIAAVLTYIRREWGHGAEPVSAQEVERVRAGLQDRIYPWTVEELLQADD